MRFAILSCVSDRHIQQAVREWGTTGKCIYTPDSKIRIFLPQAMEHGVNCYGNKGPEYLSYQFITYYAGMELAETIIPGEKRHGLIKYPLDTLS